MPSKESSFRAQDDAFFYYAPLLNRIEISALRENPEVANGIRNTSRYTNNISGDVTTIRPSSSSSFFPAKSLVKENILVFQIFSRFSARPHYGSGVYYNTLFYILLVSSITCIN